MYFCSSIYMTALPNNASVFDGWYSNDLLKSSIEFCILPLTAYNTDNSRSRSGISPNDSASAIKACRYRLTVYRIALLTLSLCLWSCSYSLTTRSLLLFITRCFAPCSNTIWSNRGTKNWMSVYNVVLMMLTIVIQQWKRVFAFYDWWVSNRNSMEILHDWLISNHTSLKSL